MDVGQIRGHIRYSTVGSSRRMPEDSEVGRTIAETTVDDSNAAAFAKPRMLGEFPSCDAGLKLG